jgi:hypothetical protein
MVGRMRNNFVFFVVVKSWTFFLNSWQVGTKVTIFIASPAPHMMTIIKKTLHTGIAHAMCYVTMPVCSVFFKNWSHVWSGRCTKTSHFLYVFLTREMWVQLVNFEKCHSPLRLWLSPTGTLSPTDTAAALLLQKSNHRQAALQQDNLQWTGENWLLSPEEIIRLDAIDR